MSIWKILLASVLAASTLSQSAQSQDWPQRPVKIIVPFAPGGNADGMARIVAQRFNEVFGQQFIVENRTGAGGAIAVEAVVRSPADGTTLLWGVQPQIVILPAIAKVPYDPVKDLAPISVLATNPFVLVVSGKLPVRTVAEFVAYVRAQPAKLSYGSSGVGSVAQLAMALFLKRAGLDMTPVHYRGNAPALADVIAGHVPTMFSKSRRCAATCRERRRATAGRERRRARGADPGRPDRRRVRLSRLQRRHLERPDGAGGNAEADRRSDRGGDGPRRQGSESRRAPDRFRRRPAREQSGRICSFDRRGDSSVDRGRQSRRRSKRSACGLRPRPCAWRG